MRLLLLLLAFWLPAWSLPVAAQAGGPDLLASAPEWKRSAWKKHGSVKRDRAIHRGSGASLRIRAEKANDIRLVKPVEVRAGRFYRFSAWVKTEAVTGETPKKEVDYYQINTQSPAGGWLLLLAAIVVAVALFAVVKRTAGRG